MQDRYAGDIGDYGKLGLLRIFGREGFSIGVNWYKTQPLASEISADGGFRHQDGRYRILRNSLVRANYSDLKNGIHETTEFLELFLRNLLLSEDHPLNNRTLHISGTFKKSEKADIETKNRTLKRNLNRKPQDIF